MCSNVCVVWLVLEVWFVSFSAGWFGFVGIKKVGVEVYWFFDWLVGACCFVGWSVYVSVFGLVGGLVCWCVRLRMLFSEC